MTNQDIGHVTNAKNCAPKLGDVIVVRALHRGPELSVSPTSNDWISIPHNKINYDFQVFILLRHLEELEHSTLFRTDVGILKLYHTDHYVML